ncbi:MAG: hypothetical protein J6T72_00300 [Alphaproteobacteria bacterium]|nr:hypothetical protein [Alphaproteobacteria bacterium]
MFVMESLGWLKGFKLEVPQEVSFGVSVPQATPYLAEQCAGLYKNAPYHRTTKK